MKGSVQEGDITLVNIHAPNTETPKYIKQILTDIKGEINNNTIIVRDFNTPPTSIRSSRQKINKAIVVLNDTIDGLHFTDYLQDIPSKNSRIHILFKYTCNVH